MPRPSTQAQGAARDHTGVSGGQVAGPPVPPLLTSQAPDLLRDPTSTSTSRELQLCHIGLSPFLQLSSWACQ
ncbi:hypothetical protein NDU88_011133 [Pleurodeles waltl]|uniref:Uncharacterized protein n=1 Tax=Pleurodeles waltl TaxID=8319 RepID=A0AAV7QWC9_PLEWA|nr:hypothetical protein NDU88_011133 [Pleurodeles waltl]